MRGEYRRSERRACELMGTARSTCRYAPRPERQRAEQALRERLRELAAERRRFGYRRLLIFLEREGWRVNHKRVYRLYRAEGLAVRRESASGSARRNVSRWLPRRGRTSAGRWILWPMRCMTGGGSEA